MAALTIVGGENSPAVSAIVETLEDLLAQARRGEIMQLAAAYVHDDGRTSSQWASAAHQHQATLLGAIDIMHEEIRTHMRNR